MTPEEMQIAITAENKASKVFKDVANDADQMANRIKGSSDKAKGAGDKLGNSLGGMGRKAGQAGIQVQQLVGQIQGGTNPMFALSQQAADLGFVLGVPLAGAIAGISASIISAFLPALFESKKSSSELIDELTDLIDTQGSLGEAQKNFLDLQYEKRIKEQEEAVEDYTDALLANSNRIQALGMLIQNNQKYGQQTAHLEESLTNLYEKETKILSDLETAQKALADTRDRSGKEQRDFIANLEKQVVLFDASKSTVLAYEAALKNLTPANQAYADSLIASLEAMEAEKEAKKLVSDDLKELTRMRLFEEENNIRTSYARQLQALEEFHAQGKISKEQYATASKNINSRMMDDVTGSLSQGLTALGNYNKTAFKAAKVFNTANAIMNTYAGVTKALAAYPPPFSYAMAAGQLAFGMAQVAQIKSQSFSGRAVGGAVSAGTPYMVGEQGRELFIPNQSGQIVKNSDLNAQSAGSANITFNISTVDATGFDQLLDSRRGMIVGMINRAMNERGRAGVV